MLFNKCGGERAGDTSVGAMRDVALVAMLQCVGDLGAKAYTVRRRQRRREKNVGSTFFKCWFNIF